MIVMNSFRTCEDENYGEARLGTNWKNFNLSHLDVSLTSENLSTADSCIVRVAIYPYCAKLTSRPIDWSTTDMWSESPEGETASGPSNRVIWSLPADLAQFSHIVLAMPVQFSSFSRFRASVELSTWNNVLAIWIKRVLLHLFM
jgi:hypothetical protein